MLLGSCMLCLGTNKKTKIKGQINKTNRAYLPKTVVISHRLKLSPNVRFLDIGNVDLVPSQKLLGIHFVTKKNTSQIFQS